MINSEEQIERTKIKFFQRINIVLNVDIYVFLPEKLFEIRIVFICILYTNL